MISNMFILFRDGGEGDEELNRVSCLGIVIYWFTETKCQKISDDILVLHMSALCICVLYMKYGMDSSIQTQMC